jgi:hypothetical protein
MVALVRSSLRSRFCAFFGKWLNMTIQEVVASVEHFCARHVVSLDELGRRKFGDRHRFEAFVDEECRNLVMVVTCEAMATVEGSRIEAGKPKEDWFGGKGSE